MKKRLSFLCWSCKRTYTLLREIGDTQELIVQCRFCGAEAIASLEPYQGKKKTVLRGEREEQTAIGDGYDFPEAIPTRRPS